MSFLDSGALWRLFWAVPVFLSLCVYAFFRRKTLMKRLFPAGAPAGEKYSSLAPGKRLFRAFLLLFAIFALGFAAARPAWGEKILPDIISGRDLLFILDISKSMLSDNVRPTRLAHAKQLIRELVKKDPGDRFGLIAASGNAELVCPVTSDTGTFLRALDKLSPADAKRGGTNLQTALDTAYLALRSGAGGANRAVLLLSDGGELEGDMKKTFSQFKKAAIPIFAIGIGEPGTPALIPVPGKNGGSSLLKDRAGNTVQAPLEENSLRAAAAETNGIYLRSGTVSSGWNELEKRIHALTPETAAFSATRKIERAAWPLSAAFLALLFFFLTSETKDPARDTARAAAKTWLLLLLVSAWIPAARAQEKLTPPPAAEGQEKNTEKPSAIELYNSAVHLQKEGKTPEAATLYEKAIASAGKFPEVRANSCQNLGVISHQNARALAEKAKTLLRKQQLDASLKALSDSLEKLNAAEENYRELMRSFPEKNAVAARNQALLIRDRKNFEKLKKKQEELKKQQQKARQKTQQALDQQQKQNQQDQQKDQQQKQNQQDQQNQQKGQAQQQTRQARQAAEQLSKQADELKQDKLRDSAREAEKKLQDAEQSQKQKNGASAEKALKEALKKLGGEPEKKPQGKPEQKKPDSGRKKGEKPEGGDADRREEGKPGDGRDEEGQAASAKESPGKPSQERKDLESAVDRMKQKNRKFQEDLRERRKARIYIAPVEKDW